MNMQNENERNELATVSREMQAIQQMPPNIALLKMENETIMSVARAQPRDPMLIVAQLQKLIDAYPAAADEAIYRKPVGTVQEITCAKCGVKYEETVVDANTACPNCGSNKHAAIRRVKKFAENLSIRAAESIRSIYGYTRLAVTEEMLPDGRVKITGVLVDYAAGNVTSDERIVSPFYKSRQGKMVRTPEDRFLNVVVKAEKAKLRRDIILDSIPNIVKAMFRDACEKKLATLVAPEVIEQKILPAFKQYGIGLEHLEKLIGRPKKLGWREEDRVELRKLLTALNNGETTAEELLADIAPRPQVAAKNGDVSRAEELARELAGPESKEQESGSPAQPAVEQVGKGGLVTIPQEAWESLDPVNRREVSEIAHSVGVVILTAEADQCEEIETEII